MGERDGKIYFLVEWSIPPGQTDDWKRELARMGTRIKEEGGCRFMDFYLSNDGTSAYAVEQFADSAEVAHHMQSVADLMESYYLTCELKRYYLLGDVTPALEEMMAPFGPIRAGHHVSIN